MVPSLVASSTEIDALTEGWNKFIYSTALTDSLPVALASISGTYTTIYKNDPTTEQAWQMYDHTVVEQQPAFADLVNDLNYLEFGNSYWIYVTQTMTPNLGMLSRHRALPEHATQLPRATFYGWVTPTLGILTPTVGMTVIAQINGQTCGEGVITDTVDPDQLAYKLQVKADVGGNGCGAAGRTILFLVADEVMGTDALG